MKDIEGYEGLYAVTRDGKVYSHRADRFLILNRNRAGYARTHLSNAGKDRGFSVHRLVAAAYIPNPENLPYVNHKDEVKWNNDVVNLEWCTAKYNTNYSIHNNSAYRTAKLTPEVRDGITRLRATGLSYEKIGKVYGVGMATVRDYLKGYTWAR